MIALDDEDDPDVAEPETGTACRGWPVAAGAPALGCDCSE